MDPALKAEILEVLERAADMTIATVRPDGYPQATTVSYAHDGLSIYFGTGSESQKARNIVANRKVSLTVNLPYANWAEIRGLSIGGQAEPLRDPSRIEHAAGLLLRKFPQGIAEYATGELAGIVFFVVNPVVISVLDYRKGFGHTELVRVTRSESSPARTG
jgi:hypothetical protein